MMKSCSAFDSEIYLKLMVDQLQCDLQKSPKSCVSFQSQDTKDRVRREGHCGMAVCVCPLSGSLKANQKPPRAKTNRLQENAYPATYLGFQSSKERLCFHVAPKTPFALFSNIFNNAKKRVLFIQISSLPTNVNISREDGKNSLEFS